MHKLKAIAGGWTPDTEGVIFVEQTPGEVIILTAADTDIQTLAQVDFPQDFPAVRVVNLLQLQQQLSIDSYAEGVASLAKVIVVRLLGGRAYWSYGLEMVKELATTKQIDLIVMPGDDRPDPTLMSHSTVDFRISYQLWQYFCEGGKQNLGQGLRYVAHQLLDKNYSYGPPEPVPKFGCYGQDEHPAIAILFYRSHYLAGNTEPIDQLMANLRGRGLKVGAWFASSLQEGEVQEQLREAIVGMALILNTTSFAVGKFDQREPTALWSDLNVPVLQVVLCRSSRQQWADSWLGLTPPDMAMNVALPEVDGRIFTRAISFKGLGRYDDRLETEVVGYEGESDRVDFVAALAENWVRLASTAPEQRRIALILANYPNKDGRLANGVGLDTPASCVEILQKLKLAGYTIGDIPGNSDRLMTQLTQGVTNDLELQPLRQVNQTLGYQDYQAYFLTLPQDVQRAVIDRWGPVLEEDMAIAGMQLGHIFVGIQPSRGYDRDPSLNYHAPDLEPTHHYLAFYCWLRLQWQAQAIVHVGKHGNAEWLPGKSLALSQSCYPEIVLGPLPHFYPFIINDPGEGSQAKRRGQAVILDHLTPPLTRAELYGELQEVEGLIDEYYQAQALDPQRLPTIRDRLDQVLKTSNLEQELGLTTDTASDRLDSLLLTLDGYLCELKEAQIRDGLHILGQCPTGEQLRDLAIAIARYPTSDRPGLTQAIAQDLGLNFDPLTAELGQRYPDNCQPLQAYLPPGLTQYTYGDLVAALEYYAIEIVAPLITDPLHGPHQGQSNANDRAVPTKDHERDRVIMSGPATAHCVIWLTQTLLPHLDRTEDEITNLLRGLDGQYIPAGPSGAPTRGRPDVLPTGRNFYSVDLRGMPTETAWLVGKKAAAAVVENYTQDHGEYPRHLALSIWGTSTMRTGGDDVAQVLALLGVMPQWDGVSRRVIGFEILDPQVLGRPRVDVTVRISGFFRDSFPNVVKLLHDAIAAVSNLEETSAINPIAAQVEQDQQTWEAQGLTPTQARERSTYRIFGSKPGAYGAGLQGLIEAQNWDSSDDLARAYMNWSSYAYDGKKEGVSAPEAFTQRLNTLQIVLHNQDNREHDLLDSDDYYQFQGGLTAAVKAVQGKNPEVYFGDNALASNPKVRKLTEQIARVYRSRVINPKWIKGVQRHGYKGAFELAATVDYLFAYGATTGAVQDYMYQGVAESYLLDDQVKGFVEAKNPWALRDMGERLLEAHQRGLWRSPPQELIDQLKMIVNETEGLIEGG